MGFAGASVVKKPPTKALNSGDASSIPRLGRSSGEGNGNPLQFSHLEKSHRQGSLVGYSPWGSQRVLETEVWKHHTREE